MIDATRTTRTSSDQDAEPEEDEEVRRGSRGERGGWAGLTPPRQVFISGPPHGRFRGRPPWRWICRTRGGGPAALGRER